MKHQRLFTFLSYLRLSRIYGGKSLLPRRQLIVCVLAAAGLMPLAAAQHGPPPYQRHTFATGTELAQAENKPMLLVFGRSNCGYCRKFEANVLIKDEMAGLLSRVILVKIDMDGEEDGHLVREYGIYNSPTMILMSTDIEEIDRIVGYQSLQSFSETLADYLAGRNTLAVVERGLADQPDDPEVNYRMLKKHLDRRQSEPAYRLCRKVVQLDPKNTTGFTDDALYSCGAYLHKRQHRPKQALQFLIQVLERYPRSDRAHDTFYRMTRCYVDLKQPDAVVDLYMKHVSRLPESGRAHRTVAQTLNKSDRNNPEYSRLALHAAKQAAALEPTAWSHYVLAVAHQHLQQWTEATAAIDKALADEPDTQKYKQLKQQIDKSRESAPEK